MMQTVEAFIEEDGTVKLLEAVRLPSARRALVTILDEPAAPDVRSLDDSAEPSHAIDSMKPRPKFGSGKGVITMREDFDAPLEDFRDYME